MFLGGLRQAMKEQLTDQQNEAILKALNDTIENGPWDKSNFLKAVGKNLTDIRDDFLTQVQTNGRMHLKAESNLANRIALRSGQREVYISLYASDGVNLHSWEKIVANLPGQVISRPIYADEEDVKEALKLKTNQQNEAYVAIYIHQTDILSVAPEKASLDKLGKVLLSLKNNALNLENISRFVHKSGVYRYEHGRLVH